MDCLPDDFPALSFLIKNFQNTFQRQLQPLRNVRRRRQILHGKDSASQRFRPAFLTALDLTLSKSFVEAISALIFCA